MWSVDCTDVCFWSWGGNPGATSLFVWSELIRVLGALTGGRVSLSALSSGI